MRRSTAAELKMDRELVHHFLEGKTCMLCPKHLPREQRLLIPAQNVAFGDRCAPPIKVKLTIHHVDGDHSNNRPSNRAVVHATCHKRWHSKHTMYRVNGTFADRRFAPRGAMPKAPHGTRKTIRLRRRLVPSQRKLGGKYAAE